MFSRPGGHHFSRRSIQDDFWKKKCCWSWEAPLDGDREPGARPIGLWLLRSQEGLGYGNDAGGFVKVPASRQCELLDRELCLCCCRNANVWK